MTSILVGIYRIPPNNLKRHYLQNERLFLDFLLHFWNELSTENVREKKMSILA